MQEKKERKTQIKGQSNLTDHSQRVNRNDQQIFEHKFNISKYYRNTN